MYTGKRESLLIKKIKGGDKNAFEIAFLKYYSPLCKHIWKYVRSKDLARGIAQEVFTKIWEAREELDPEGHLRGFLYQMARNEALNYIKHQKIASKYIAEQREREEDRYYEPYEVNKTNPELLHTIRAAIQDLPLKARRIFILNRKEGLTYQEIAGYLNISIKTVESQMSRVFRLLRERLSEYYLLLC